VVGVDGAILSPGGTPSLAFSWRLGTTMNNQAEAYDFLLGLILARQHELVFNGKYHQLQPTITDF